MSITKEDYDIYASKSFFVDNNFSGRYAPSNIGSNMIPCNLLQEFHCQTSFFLHFYSSLYIELQKHQSDISFNVSKFANTIENMIIKLDLTKKSDSSPSNYKLSDFSQNSQIYTFTFYVARFQEKTSNPEHLYKYGTPSGNVSYDSSYSSIIDKSKPNFGSYPNTLNLGTSSSYVNEVIKIQDTQTYYTNQDLKRENSLPLVPDNKKIFKYSSKFKEIIEEIFSKKPENIIGYLLYKKIYYNIILYNIAIQNSIRIEYLNNSSISIDSSTYFDDDQTGYNNNIVPVRSQINENTLNINELSKSHFISENNDFLLEKNEYRNKINALNTLKEEYNKIQDKLNISTKLYNQQFKNYKTIKYYATYVIIALIIIIILTISLSIFPIFSVDVKNSIYIISLIVLIVITYLYYTNFKYVNLYEKFDPITYYYLSTLTITPNTSDDTIAGSNSGYLVGKTYNLTVSTSGYTTATNSRNELGDINATAIAGKFVRGIYPITVGEGGTGFASNAAITFSGGGGSGAIAIVKTVTGDNNSISTIEITATGSNYTSTPDYSIARASGVSGTNASFRLNFGQLTTASINITKNTLLFTTDINGSVSLVTAPPAETNITVSGETTTAANRKAIITATSATTQFNDIFALDTKGVYYTEAQRLSLNADKTVISENCSSNLNFSATNASHRTNHAKFYTQLLPAINQYNNAYNDLMNNIRMNMYTIGSKTFSQDANIYLYNLYLEKKRQNENNKIKYTNLFNMIEIIKKQINFLFNIVFILGCFCIILLLGLVLYSTTPELYIFIIILCVVLISILMIYFGFAIIQPTRMIVNKNYWAIVNPSKTAISKL